MNRTKIDIIHLLLGWIEDDVLTEEQEILAFAIIGMLASDEYEEINEIIGAENEQI